MLDSEILSIAAQSALIHRVVGIAFELLGNAHANDTLLAVAGRLDVGFHDAGGHTAAGAAERAHARLPLRDARYEVFVRHEANELVLRVSTARKRGGGPGDGGQLDEVASVHAQCNPCLVGPVGLVSQVGRSSRTHQAYQTHTHQAHQTHTAHLFF